MSLWGRLTGAEARRQLDELRTERDGLIEMRSIDSLPWNTGSDVISSRTPTSTQATRLSTIYAAIALVARNISTLPLHGFRDTDADGLVRLRRLPSLFAHPSIHGDLVDWLFACLTSLLTDGNAYGLITARDGYSYPTNIEWLHPEQVMVIDQNLWGRGSYFDPIIYWRGREMNREDIVHIPYFSVPFRYKGLSPLGALASPIDTGLAARVFEGDWYKSGGLPPSTFKNSTQKVSDVESEKIRDRLVVSIRAHKPLVYGADWEFNPILISPKDSMIAEARQMSANDIAVVYGIHPPERIGGQTKTAQTYVNIEHDQIMLVQETLLPLVHKLESVFYDLLPDPQRVIFDLDSRIRPDAKSRWEVHQIRREIGASNIDEIRDMEHQPRLPNKRGQDYDPLTVRKELIRASAATTGDPNQPGFQTEPPPGPPQPTVKPEPAPVASSNGNGRSHHPDPIRLPSFDPPLTPIETRLAELYLRASTDEERMAALDAIERGRLESN
jgi:HK97 family phage portal protein